MNDQAIDAYLRGKGLKDWLGEPDVCFVCERRGRLPVYEKGGYLACFCGQHHRSAVAAGWAINAVLSRRKD